MMPFASFHVSVSKRRLIRTIPPGPSGMKAKGEGKPISVHHPSVRWRGVRATGEDEDGVADPVGVD
jgi:hypothetical protein